MSSSLQMLALMLVQVAIHMVERWGKGHALFPRRIFYRFNREYQLGINTLIYISQQVFTLPALWKMQRLQATECALQRD